MKFPDHHVVLALARAAADEIKQAFRKLARLPSPSEPQPAFRSKSPPTFTGFLRTGSGLERMARRLAGKDPMVSAGVPP